MHSWRLSAGGEGISLKVSCLSHFEIRGDLHELSRVNDIENIMLSEISQMEKVKNHMISLICGT